MRHIKKIITLTLSFLICSFVIANNAYAGLLYNYSDLALKDLDQMSKIVKMKIEESRKADGDKVIPLKEALQAVFSRSNEDFMIEKIISPLRTELEEHDAWESTVRSLTKEAIGALKNPKAFKPVVQSTYIVFLDNLLSEIKPRGNEKFEHKLLEEIAKADIEISKQAENERRLRGMKNTTSPSEVAEDILKKMEEAAKAAAKEKK